MHTMTSIRFPPPFFLFLLILFVTLIISLLMSFVLKYVIYSYFVFCGFACMRALSK